MVVPRKIQDEVKKRLKNRELIDRFYKKLQKLETEPSVYGKPLRKPLSNIWEIYLEKGGECSLKFTKKSESS